MSISACPTPTVLDEDFVLARCVHQQGGLQGGFGEAAEAPRLAIERMKTPASRKWSERRMRSPSRAPRVNGLDGSIESTATSRSAFLISAVSAPINVLFPNSRGPGEAHDARPAGAGKDLAYELPAAGFVRSRSG